MSERNDNAVSYLRGRILGHVGEFGLGGLDRVVEDALRAAWDIGHQAGQTSVRRACEKHLAKRSER